MPNKRITFKNAVNAWWEPHSKGDGRDLVVEVEEEYQSKPTTQLPGQTTLEELIKEQ